MDSVTHVLMGMAIGELTLGKKEGKKSLLWGAVFASIPDIDSVFQYLFSPTSSILIHRGISHSLLILFLLSPLAAYLINRLYKGDRKSLKGWLRLVFFAWISHLALDVFNTYGTGLFEPFSRVRISYDSIGISDLFFLLPLIAAAAVSLLSRNIKKISTITAAAALSLSFIYLGCTIVNKQNIEKFVRNELHRQGIEYTRILTSPLPITNFAWMALAENEKGFWQGTYSQTTESVINFVYIPKNYNLAFDIENFKDFKKLQRFSRGYYALRKDADNRIILSDLRFGYLDNAPNRPQKGGLNFTLHPEPVNGRLVLKRSHPKRNVNLHSIIQYLKRIS